MERGIPMKKLFPITLVITLLILTLTGCAGKTTSGNTAPQSIQNQKDTTAPQNTQNKKDTEAQPDEGKQIKIKVLEKSWKKIGQYSEGLCPVLDDANGLWGYVDKSGEYVIKPSYYEAHPFSEDLAAVKNKNGVFDFIDKTGKIVLATKYQNIHSRYRGALIGFLEGYALVSMGNLASLNGFSLIDKTGKIFAQDDYFFRISSYGNKTGPFIDCQGDIVNMQYKKIIVPQGQGIKIDFNYSTKYILSADKIVDDKGTVIFDASRIEVNSFGLTDDYLVAKKNVMELRPVLFTISAAKLL